MQQLRKGKKIEKEHRNTYELVRKYGIPKKDKEFYEMIARDHLKEDADYYTKLKKAGL
jgi:hypothetical protein